MHCFKAAESTVWDLRLRQWSRVDHQQLHQQVAAWLFSLQAWLPILPAFVMEQITDTPSIVPLISLIIQVDTFHSIVAFF